MRPETIQNGPKKIRNRPKPSENDPKTSETVRNRPKPSENGPKTIENRPKPSKNEKWRRKVLRDAIIYVKGNWKPFFHSHTDTLHVLIWLLGSLLNKKVLKN